MVSLIDSSTVGLLSLALDAAGMRQQAIAQNIANVNTPGYRRMGVSFETRLDELKQDVQQGRAPSLAGLAAFRPQFEAAGAAGEAVTLDTEMASLSENTLHHQALLKALNKHFALIGSAINEGKR
ncbi:MULTISPECIES: flagellar basal body rod protein FlgB [unclassified Duganella]|uniref:flagellar basal body rod protein FlgB n=1 Tax=unclassified Duganella TaxID=2636909 RepID=UPI000874FDB1|nr:MULTISPECIES: flagellar basal body rod protein FlgB [unclassified Duganella]OEZ54745.1 flagellar basal body rod protein FlgB [Duganella sp. HH105]OEZ96671.1 flagellar basal body rod protein FlgB [Duganella sp. HH101]